MKKIIIGIIATLDTKDKEVEYIKHQIEEEGCYATVIDVGSMGSSFIKSDISNEIIAKKGGSNLRDLAKSPRGDALEIMADGARKIVKELYSEGKIDGIIGLGGSGGTFIAISAMKVLPIGFPKLVVATHMAYSKQVEREDIAIIQTPTDLMGLNKIIKRTLSQAVGSIVGMVKASVPKEADKKPLLGMTALGVTTTGAMKIISFISKRGYEVAVFHNDSYNLEKLVEDRIIKGVIDLTPNELNWAFITGLFPERKSRLEIVGEMGVPQIIVPGGLDMLIFREPKEGIPIKFRERKLYIHSPSVTLVRTNKEENEKLGKIIAEKANKARGRVAIVIPLQGFSKLDKKGCPFYDLETDKVFIRTIEDNIKEQIKVFGINAHINSDKFAKKIVDIFDEIKK